MSVIIIDFTILPTATMCQFICTGCWEQGFYLTSAVLYYRSIHIARLGLL